MLSCFSKVSESQKWMTRNFTDIIAGKLKIAQHQNTVILFISSESFFHDNPNALKRSLEHSGMKLNNEIYNFLTLYIEE